MYEGSRFDRCRWRGCDASCVDEFELCWYHFRLAGETFIETRSAFGSAALIERKRQREEERAGKPDPHEAKVQWQQARSVVYYIRIGDHVKIGFTSGIAERLVNLRVDPDALLAVEPGWRETEHERHVQFAAERQGKRENFNPSRRLMAHISVMRSKYGDPLDYAARRAELAGPLSVRL